MTDVQEKLLNELWHMKDEVSDIEEWWNLINQGEVIGMQVGNKHSFFVKKGRDVIGIYPGMTQTYTFGHILAKRASPWSAFKEVFIIPVSRVRRVNPILQRRLSKAFDIDLETLFSGYKNEIFQEALEFNQETEKML